LSHNDVLIRRGQTGRGLLDPVATPVGHPTMQARDAQLGLRTAPTAFTLPRQARLQACQAPTLAAARVRPVQQLRIGRGDRRGHTWIDAHRRA
jgi:hypothetical protein